MKTPNFTFEIKGVTLDMCEMNTIHEQYQIFTTAEYLMENYHFEEKEALRLAADVRRLMDKYDYAENEAISRVVLYGNKQ